MQLVRDIAERERIDNELQALNNDLEARIALRTQEMRDKRVHPQAAANSLQVAARLQSFALAAQELNLTPSAVSHQIRDLERHFGRPLFERRHRRVQTTPEGQRLYESLARVFDALEAAWRAAMWAKPAGHGINDPGFIQPARPMSAIGG